MGVQPPIPPQKRLDIVLEFVKLMIKNLGKWNEREESASVPDSKRGGVSLPRTTTENSTIF